MFLDVSAPRWFRIHNISQILQYKPNITISAKYHNISQIYINFDQISQFQQNLTISTKFHNFHQISRFPPNFTILTNCHISDQISRGLINWAQTLLCKFISSHKHFVFNKTNCVFSLFVMMFFHLISSLKVLPASGPYVLPWLHMGRIWRKRKKEEVIILRVKSQ